jgi:hypothetical protein
MSEEKSESVMWSMFKETIVGFAMILGFAWVFLSSVLMLTTVLRAIFR